MFTSMLSSKLQIGLCAVEVRVGIWLYGAVSLWHLHVAELFLVTVAHVADKMILLSSPIVLRVLVTQRKEVWKQKEIQVREIPMTGTARAWKHEDMHRQVEDHRDYRTSRGQMWKLIPFLPKNIYQSIKKTLCHVCENKKAPARAAESHDLYLHELQ